MSTKYPIDYKQPKNDRIFNDNNIYNILQQYPSITNNTQIFVIDGINMFGAYKNICETYQISSFNSMNLMYNIPNIIKLIGYNDFLAHIIIKNHPTLLGGVINNESIENIIHTKNINNMFVSVINYANDYDLEIFNKSLASQHKITNPKEKIHNAIDDAIVLRHTQTYINIGFVPIIISNDQYRDYADFINCVNSKCVPDSIDTIIGFNTNINLVQKFTPPTGYDVFDPTGYLNNYLLFKIIAYHILLTERYVNYNFIKYLVDNQYISPLIPFEALNRDFHDQLIPTHFYDRNTRQIIDYTSYIISLPLSRIESIMQNIPNNEKYIYFYDLPQFFNTQIFYNSAIMNQIRNNLF